MVILPMQRGAHGLQWRHNEHNGVANHRRLDCLFNRLFRRRSKKTSKLRVTGLCEGNSQVTCEFPAQMASNAENVSIWWCHHGASANWLIIVSGNILPTFSDMPLSKLTLIYRRMDLWHQTSRRLESEYNVSNETAFLSAKVSHFVSALRCYFLQRKRVNMPPSRHYRNLFSNIWLNRCNSLVDPGPLILFYKYFIFKRERLTFVKFLGTSIHIQCFAIDKFEHVFWDQTLFMNNRKLKFSKTLQHLTLFTNQNLLKHWGLNKMDTILHFWHFEIHLLEWPLPNFPEKGLVANYSAMVQVMAWRRTGDKPLPDPVLTQIYGVYIYIYITMSQWVNWRAVSRGDI